MRKSVVILFGGLLLSTASFAFQAQAPAAVVAPAKKTKPAPVPPQTPAQIGDAKAKGMVWVNLNTGVYHKDGEFFGKTKSGKFMMEDDAKKAGHRAAKEPTPKKAPKTSAAAPAAPAKK